MLVPVVIFMCLSCYQSRHGLSHSIVQRRIKAFEHHTQPFLKILSAVLTVSDIISSSFILLGDLLKNPIVPYAHRVSGKGDVFLLSSDTLLFPIRVSFLQQHSLDQCFQYLWIISAKCVENLAWGQSSVLGHCFHLQEVVFRTCGA